ncbi:hypothetical protein HY385_01045 [Candidatus Daviesbacteria bacterium]|nr:hypothetical protein [Candidatus Daviesbacteria bacterium]
MPNIKSLFQNRLTVGLVIIIVLIIIGGFFAYQKFIAAKQAQLVEEVDLSFDPEGPYAIISPRRDGNALVLNIKRTGSYDQIKYELAYNSEGVDRGAAGDINTKERKGEYEQEILFGSCSTGGKCVYDKDVENGTLTLHIRKGKQAFRMVSQWHLQKPDVALGVLTSGDGHLTNKIDPNSTDLSLVKFVITNDLSGAPKLSDGKTITGKAYAINAPIAKTVPNGVVTIDLPNNPPDGSKIARYDDGKNSWVEYDTKIDGSKLTATADGGGVFAVLAPSTK